MNDLEKRILLAQSNSGEIDCLLSDYLPFIKKQLTNMQTLGLEYDDALSLAMLTFVGCIKQYKENRGGFLSFAAVSINNRLIDENRNQQKHHSKVVTIHANEDENAGDIASLEEYSRDKERQTLADEIDALSKELQPFGVKFAELTKICPKQNRSRRLCIQAAQNLIQDDDMKANLMQNKRISQTKLANQLDVSEKTIEKHRKYIVTICVVLTGDFPNIKAFLPQFKEVE